MKNTNFLFLLILFVPDAEHAVDIIPDSPSEAGRVDIRVTTHRVIGEVVCSLEFFIQQIPHVIVQAVD